MAATRQAQTTTHMIRYLTPQEDVKPNTEDITTKDAEPNAADSEMKDTVPSSQKEHVNTMQTTPEDAIEPAIPPYQTIIKEEEIELMVQALARIFDGLCKSSDAEEIYRTSFHANAKASISLHDYIKRIQKYGVARDKKKTIFGIGIGNLIQSIILMDRFTKRSNIYLDSFSAHRLIAVSMLISVKFLNDNCPSNSYWAAMSGLGTNELNNLEFEFLKELNFHITIDQNEYIEYAQAIKNEMNAVQNELDASSGNPDNPEAKLGAVDNSQKLPS